MSCGARFRLSAQSLPPLALARLASSAKLKVVYHLNDLDKVSFVVGNIQNHFGLKDLLPGFIVADRGGVVRIAELQSQGYLYLKP